MLTQNVTPANCSLLYFASTLPTQNVIKDQNVSIVILLHSALVQTTPGPTLDPPMNKCPRCAHVMRFNRVYTSAFIIDCNRAREGFLKLFIQQQCRSNMSYAIGPKCEHRIYSKLIMKGCLRLVINKGSRCNKMPYIFLDIFNNCII